MKKYSEMSDEEKLLDKQRKKRYNEAHPEIPRKCALTYYYKNKDKQKQKHKQWYEKNKDYCLEQQKIKKRERKLWAIDYLGNKCSNCFNIYHPSVYEFHHRIPEEKDKDPSKMMLLSKERLKVELDKCILLCANCHRFLHHGENY